MQKGTYVTNVHQPTVNEGERGTGGDQRWSDGDQRVIDGVAPTVVH